jgi:hypothetical protein
MYKEWKGSKWSKDMEHLELQAPQPSLDIAFSLMKAMQGIFAGALVELAFCKSISRQLPRGCGGCAFITCKRDGIGTTNTMRR